MMHTGRIALLRYWNLGDLLEIMNAYTVSERKFLGKHPLERMRGRRKDTIRTDCTKTECDDLTPQNWTIASSLVLVVLKSGALLLHSSLSIYNTFMVTSLKLLPLLLFLFPKVDIVVSSITCLQITVNNMIRHK